MLPHHHSRSQDDTTLSHQAVLTPCKRSSRRPPSAHSNANTLKAGTSSGCSPGSGPGGSASAQLPVPDRAPSSRTLQIGSSRDPSARSAPPDPSQTSQLPTHTQSLVQHPWTSSWWGLPVYLQYCSANRLYRPITSSGIGAIRAAPSPSTISSVEGDGRAAN